MRLGVHEFLVKPTSAKMLCDRVMAIATSPGPMMTVGEWYVPQPRDTLHSQPDNGKASLLLTAPPN
jgi:hypothetical protein